MTCYEDTEVQFLLLPSYVSPVVKFNVETVITWWQNVVYYTERLVFQDSGVCFSACLRMEACFWHVYEYIMQIYLAIVRVKNKKVTIVRYYFEIVTFLRVISQLEVTVTICYLLPQAKPHQHQRSSQPRIRVQEFSLILTRISSVRTEYEHQEQTNGSLSTT